MQYIGGDSRKVRGVNREIVLERLRTDGPLSLAELAVATGLSLATCSNIVGGLVADGAATEEEVRESRGGRPARRFNFNPRHVLVATIIARLVKGREELHYRLVDAAGGRIAEGGDAVPGLGPDHIDALIARLAKKYPALGAAALSVPGIVDRGVIEICDAPGLIGCEIVKLIRERRGLEAVVENDMNFAAIGFARSPRSGGAAGVCYMVFPGDACAGSGLVVNGLLVKGKSNFAGEISFLPFSEDRERRNAKRNDRAWLTRHIATTVTAVAAVVNPDTVVVSGDGIDGDWLPDVERLCHELLPAQHCPALAFIPDYTEDCQSGMAAMALDCLRCDYQLIRKERTWCIDG